MTLRLLSYLAPSLPTGLFEALARHLGASLGTDVDLRFDTTRSGPRPGEDEPFTTGEVDLAFVCATSYVWLTTAPAPAVGLVGAAWVPTDPRADGRAVYFGDVLAPAAGPRSLGELAGRRVAYNDAVSLSGYHSLRLALTAAGIALDRVELVHSGSHLRSLELLATGAVDAAAIDSTVWRRRRREDPVLGQRLDSVAALGPHPVQPLVARTDLSRSLRDEVRAALLTAGDADETAAALARAELTRFVAVREDDYAALRAQMDDLGPGRHVVPSARR